jgi:hypothetical protein
MHTHFLLTYISNKRNARLAAYRKRDRERERERETERKRERKMKRRRKIREKIKFEQKFGLRIQFFVSQK